MRANARSTLRRASCRAVVVLLLANCVFFLLAFVAPGDPAVVRERVRAAFESGELGFSDRLPFDRRRGFNQYNDCNILQMLGNANPTRLARALSPIIYSTDSWTDQCVVLYRTAVEPTTAPPLIDSRYSRYWHGYNIPVAFALRGMQIGSLRRLLAGSVWLSVLAFAVLTFRRGAAVRRTGLAIAITASAFWAIPYFGPSFSHGFGDAAVLLGLAVLAVRPQIALRLDTLVPYAAGFAAVIVFFEMLTGQLPIAAAWLIAFIVATRRDHALDADTPLTVLVVAAVVAFGIGGLITEGIKQILALALTDPQAGGVFFSHLVDYSAVPTSSGKTPGIFLPFVRL
jgi:hypothetical protein